jgi:hypothetical protein
MYRLEAIFRGRIISRFLSLVFVMLELVSCESTNYVPSVTSQMAAAANRPNVHTGTIASGAPVSVATLRLGRTLLVQRCIECHTLPPLWHYRAEDWPDIVKSMASRAGLKPGERDAVIAYIRAVRSEQ